MKIPLPKLKAMIRFFGTYTDKSLLGKVKLMKLFYFADFGHLKKYGVPITWDTYIHLDYGPVPSGIMDLVSTVTEDLDNSVLADTIRIEKTESNYLHRIVPLKKFVEQDERLFSKREIEVMKEVCARFATKTAKEIEDASHKESAWRETYLLQEISYSLAAKDNNCLVSKEEIELALKILN